jgi:hypothetical protein
VNRNLVAAAAAACVLVGSVAPVSAVSPNTSAYADASWYQKYLVVSSGVAPLCTGNSGEVTQPDFGTNLDASHECGSQSETSIAINPANPQNVIAGSNEIQRLPMRAMWSKDGGATFTGVDLPLPPARTNNGYDYGSDPGVAFDSAGNAYYSYIVVYFGTGGGINGTAMAVARSADGGAKWTATYFAPQTGNGQFNDKPMITVDTGTAHHDRIYVAWDHATGNSSSAKNGNNVLLSWSDDHGVTFSTPVSVSGDFTGRTGGIGADPYVAPDGTVHVAWQDYAHGAILDAASTDGGLTFAAPVRIASVAAFEFAVAAQSSRGALVYPACGASSTALYCAYMNGSSAATHVYVAKSTDGGATWTSTAMPGGGDQFNQWLAVDPIFGSVNVAYYDTGTHGATATLYTLATSLNGGAGWAANAIATAPTDESCCVSTGVNLGNQYGDYEGVAAFDGVVRPVWTDRREGVIALALREEVFTAAVTQPAP